jgi:hypothetical protein
MRESISSIAVSREQFDKMCEDASHYLLAHLDYVDVDDGTTYQVMFDSHWGDAYFREVHG